MPVSRLDVTFVQKEYGSTWSRLLRTHQSGAQEPSCLVVDGSISLRLVWRVGDA
jgi:hypothetical protein